MKKPKCKHCNKSISRTIGFIWEASSIYYLNTKKRSMERFFGDVYKSNRGKKCLTAWWHNANKVLGFYCNKCGKRFPDSETIIIKRYLFSDHIVLKLKDDPWHKN